MFDTLEDRTVPAVSLVGVPEWDEQGPGPIVRTTAAGGGQAVVNPNNRAVGAIETIAVHPNVGTNNTVLVGANNGGIWRTTTINQLNPGWDPVTDQLGAPSIGSIAFSPLDANVVFAGTGNFTNGYEVFNAYNNQGAVGVLRSTDGGVTWAQMPAGPLAGNRVRSIVPTSLGGALATQVVLAATVNGGGVFRSTDGGNSFTAVAGMGGNATDLIADPNNANRFYAALAGQGVFVSNDGGVNWNRIDNQNTAVGGVGGSSNIELAVHDAGATTVLYVGVVQGGQPLPGGGTGNVLTGVFRDTAGNDGVNNDGDAQTDEADEFNWGAIGAAPAINTGGQGFNNFAIVADPGNANLVYVGGDRHDAVFRGNAAANNWTTIVNTGANATRPHADCRDLAFLDNTTLLEADDGGLYRLTNAANVGAGDVWESRNGNIRITEFYSVAYAAGGDLIFGGTQDNGSPAQSATNSLTWNAVNPFTGDGGTTAMDNTNNTRYQVGNNFGTFQRGGAAIQLAATAGGAQFSGLDNTKNTAGIGTDRAFTAGFEIFPYVLNAADPTRMLMGREGLYESQAGQPTGDVITTITPNITGTATGRFWALAYGGRRNGAPDQGIIYAGDSGANVFVRETATGNFNVRTPAGAAGQVMDFALAPEDSHVAVVVYAGAVFRTTDAGQNWQNVTGDLLSLSSTLRSAAIVPSATGDVVLIGGLGGVYRARLDGSPNPTWVKLGANLPTVVARDLIYNDADNVLLVGTYGRGAWTVDNIRAVVDDVAVLQITGDTDFAGQDDVIRLVRNANNPLVLDVFLNGVHFGPYPLAALQQINARGFGGNDTLIVDSTNGLIDVVNGIRFDGGTGFDRLDLVQTGGSATGVIDTLAIGATNGSGRSTIVSGANIQSVDFENLEPVTDNVAAGLFRITSTPGLASLLQSDNIITYQASQLLGGGGLMLVDTFEPIEFVNKQTLIIDAGAGADTVDLINGATPLGLTAIVVNTGSGDDTLVAAPSAATPGLVVNGGLGNDYLAANGDLNGESGNDFLIGGAGGNDLDGGDGEDILDGRGGANTLDGGDDTDTILVSGTAGADTMTATHAANTFNLTGGLSAGNNTISAMEAVRVEAGSGADGITLILSADGGLAYTVLGGDPIGTLAGDSLTVNSAATKTVTAGPENDAGSVDVATAATTNVSFDEIELLILTGGGGGVLKGTNGNDAITVIARDESFNPAADGVQDFTGVVNNGMEILFLDEGSLIVEALGGSDTIVVRTPAPNNAEWDVDVTVDGGPPSAGDPAGSDRVVVETPGAAAETAVYTPSASDAGTLDLTSLSSRVTLSAIEELLYDGEADNDSLAVVGTSGDDVISHSPGAANQAGAFQVNDMLPIAYQNMGAGADLMADGADGLDNLVYFGTNANDTFRVPNAAGNVALNSRLVVETSGVETLTMEGLLGDDWFDIVPQVTNLIYGQVNANGGAEASATGDRTSLRTTGTGDAIGISGQVVTVGAKTIASTGVEGIALNAAAGVDVITYNGVPGTAEAINFISSGVVGQGQISVPGVTLVTFSGVERLLANGNTGSAGDEDTLTFTATNAIDRLLVNLAAAGTPSDPVLRLQNAAGTSTLLNLFNYSNFNTLRVNALEGEDIINVRTAATGPSRNLFVDGGAPSGKKKSTDKLTVFYTPPRPRIIHSAETQDPDAGLVDLDYGSARYLVQYNDVEDVVITK